MKIINTTKQTILANKGLLADTVISRMTGLLNKRSFEPGEALVITGCRSIHMFFMKFAIDAVFVSRDNIVVGLVKHILPFRLSPYFYKADYVIELPSGVIEETKTCVGDSVEIKG